MHLLKHCSEIQSSKHFFHCKAKKKIFFFYFQGNTIKYTLPLIIWKLSATFGLSLRNIQNLFSIKALSSFPSMTCRFLRLLSGVSVVSDGAAALGTRFSSTSFLLLQSSSTGVNTRANILIPKKFQKGRSFKGVKVQYYKMQER